MSVIAPVFSFGLNGYTGSGLALQDKAEKSLMQITIGIDISKETIWHSPFWGRALGSGTSRWKGSAWSGLPLVRGAGIGARTTHSPAHRGASPQRAGGWP